MIAISAAPHQPPDGTPRSRDARAAPQRERIVGPPTNPFPVEEPAPGTAGPLPPIGGWWAHYPAKSRAGWHVACPRCLAGRVLLAPDPEDASGYLIRPATCTVGCPARDVMRAFAWRERPSAGRSAPR